MKSNTPPQAVALANAGQAWHFVRGNEKTHLPHIETDGIIPQFSSLDYALSTAPERRHLVQTCMVLEAPFTLHFTFLILDFQILLDLLWEWLTLLPK